MGINDNMGGFYRRPYVRQPGGLRFTPINTGIIAVNVIIFLIMEFMGSTQDVGFMIRWGAEFWPLTLQEHEYYRVFTSAFLHFGFEHLASNMIVLAFIGDNLEIAMGKVKYLLFYMLCAAGSGTASFLVSMYLGELTVSAGASGAIFGVAGGVLFMIIRNRGFLEDLNFMQVGLFILFTIYQGMRSSGTNNVAHISGLILGFALAALFSLFHMPKKKI